MFHIMSLMVLVFMFAVPAEASKKPSREMTKTLERMHAKFEERFTKIRSMRERHMQASANHRRHHQSMEEVDMIYAYHDTAFRVSFTGLLLQNVLDGKVWMDEVEFTSNTDPALVDYLRVYPYTNASIAEVIHAHAPYIRASLRCLERFFKKYK